MKDLWTGMWVLGLGGDRHTNINTIVACKVGADDLLDSQVRRVDKELEELKKKGQSKIGQVFQIAKSIRGKEKECVKAHAIKDPNNGNLIVNQDDIKTVSVKYCKKVLEKNAAHTGYEELASVKVKLHEKRMDNDNRKGFMAEKEVYDNVLYKFKKNIKRNYDFLIKSSESFKDAIFKLCKRIIEDETVPDKFRDTTLHQIWKKKQGTKKEDLEANKFIHCKEWLPRAVESMVVSEMESDIRNATSKFQIGGVAGHRPQEHLFSIKSLIYK